jgi:hypothetical protein
MWRSEPVGPDCEDIIAMSKLQLSMLVSLAENSQSKECSGALPIDAWIPA